jgi:cephalosporin hydroxylase
MKGLNKKAMDPVKQFEMERREAISVYKNDNAWKELSSKWLDYAFDRKYMYNFSWLGRPIIQLPSDIVAFQEIVWNIKPDLIIETGIAHGGSLILSASMLALLDLCDAAEAGTQLDPRSPARRVLGVDIDIRAHNRAAIEAHPLAFRIDMIEGSSIDAQVIEKVQRRAAEAKRVLVCLDSNHTHAHVLAELEAYAPLVTPGSYCVVFDTVIEQLPADMFPERPWKPGDNAMTAVEAYLANHPEFVSDTDIDAKLQISVAPRGYLRRVG